jgi:glycosyltransferase involved in cell wall biosynthesis
MTKNHSDDHDKKSKKPLRVAIVAELLVKMGGAERVVKKLADMYPDAPIYTLLYDEDKCGRDFSAGRVKSSFLQKFPRFFRKRYRWLLKLMPYAAESFDLSDYDLVISSSSAFAHGVLTGSETVHVCYCHSPMRYAWDYTHDYFKQKWFGPVKTWLARGALEKIRMWDKVASDRPDYYIANSKHVQQRVRKYYRLDCDVIYPPVDVDRFKLSSKTKDYFLIISTLTSYKKIDLAVNLFNKTGKRLVIIGDGPERSFLESIAADNIEFKGRLTDEECKKHFEECRAFVFPSEEDFGIAMIEALACGKPVLAYKAGGAMEFIKPGFNGEFFEEQNFASMEDALARILLNEKKYIAKDIRKDAEKFAADRFESEMRGFNKKVLEAKQKGITIASHNFYLDGTI